MNKFFSFIFFSFLVGVVFSSCNFDDNIGERDLVIAPPSYQYAATGNQGGHDYVDLGLSVKWATCNLGANLPDSSGYYFAWGEFSKKSSFSWKTYSHCEGSAESLNYCVTIAQYSSDSQYMDGLTRLDELTDPAYNIWGENWRLPTDEEITELRKNCKFEWCSLNNRNGYKVIGPNGNSIFLPACGFFSDDKVVMDNRSGCYWSCDISPTAPYRAYELLIYKGSQVRGSTERYYGECIRPVVGKYGSTGNSSPDNQNPNNNQQPPQDPAAGDDNPGGNDNPGSDNPGSDNPGSDNPGSNPGGDNPDPAPGSDPDPDSDPSSTGV